MTDGKRVLIDGALYKTIGVTSSAEEASRIAEASKNKTGQLAGYSSDPENSGKYRVTVLDEDQTIGVVCNLCKCQFRLNIKTAVKMTKNNDGYIPCEKCGSHATHWSVDR